MVEQGQQSQLVEGQTFHKPVELESERTPPNPGLFQPYFLLTEADYLRLKSRSSVLYGLGGGILVFGLNYALTQLVPCVRARLAGISVTVPTMEIAIASICAAVGISLLVAGSITSSEKRRVINRIKKHFKDNPGHTEVR